VKEVCENAKDEGCLLEPMAMLDFLQNPKRRILRPVTVTNVKNKDVIPCYSLGHDVLASALQTWYELEKLERKTLRTVRATYGLSALGFFAGWYFIGHNWFLGILSAACALLFVVSFEQRFRSSFVESAVKGETKKPTGTGN
jgi:hypothetical protein